MGLSVKILLATRPLIVDRSFSYREHLMVHSKTHFQVDIGTLKCEQCVSIIRLYNTKDVKELSSIPSFINECFHFISPKNFRKLI